MLVHYCEQCSKYGIKLGDEVACVNTHRRIDPASVTKVVDQGTGMSESKSKRRVPAVERTVAILDFIATAPQATGLSDLARALQLPKSTAHGLCDTLCDLGLLRLTSDGFELGPASLRWSSAYLQRSDLVREFEGLLNKEVALQDYTVTLSTLIEGEVMYLAYRHSLKPLGFSPQRGMRLPAIYTATGKAMLAFMTVERRHQILTQYWLPPLTAQGVTSIEAFEQQAQAARDRGYALDEGEVRDGMVCLGVPVFDLQGQPAAGIAVSMTDAEAKPEVLTSLGALMRRIASQLLYH